MPRLFTSNKVKDISVVFLKFGPGGYLYIGLPDIPQKLTAQDLSKLTGKILRIDYNGSIPWNNPFNSSPVYSYGHINPVNMSWDSSGNLYVIEANPYTYNQKNKIIPGGNYGWDIYDCNDRIRDFEENVLAEKDVVFPEECF